MVKDVWWDNVIFREFAAHFISMSDEQVVRDIRESVVKVINLDESGDSFGANMVRRAKERLCVRHDVAVQNGKQGGRPRKESTAGGDIREDSQDRKSGTPANIYGDANHREAVDESTTIYKNIGNGQGTEALEKPRTWGDSVRRVGVASPAVCHKSAGAPVRNSGRRFRNKEEYMQWAIDSGLDAQDASDCWEATLERGGKDKDGNKVNNIKAFATQWCKTSKKNRETA